MVLIPEITSAVLSKSDIKLASKDFNSGHVETINASSGLRSAILDFLCQERHKWMQYF
jgi:hypothetical protein